MILLMMMTIVTIKTMAVTNTFMSMIPATIVNVAYKGNILKQLHDITILI